ncbi:MAG TPA: hypothetical protein VGH73_22320 [Thermoanaerobaculia bacterium]
MSPLAWIGIGCGVIIVLCVIAFGVMGMLAKRAVDKFSKNPGMTTAELMVRANPDLELVSKDEDNNTITVKDKKTGEVSTFGVDKNGKFNIKSAKGSATFDASSGNGISVKSTDEKGQVSTFNAGASGPKDLPSWLPTYPGATVQGTMDTTSNDGRSAAFTVSTKDDSTKVLDYYEAQLKSAGLKTEKSTVNTSSNGVTQTGGTVTGKSDDGKREANVIVSTNADGTQAIVTFTEKK